MEQDNEGRVLEVGAGTKVEAVLSARAKAKNKLRGREEGSQCPCEGKKQAPGKRGRLSVPVRRQKASSREERKALSSCPKVKSKLKGREEGSQCPCEGKKQAQGKRGRFSVPLRRQKASSREERKALSALAKAKSKLKGREEGSQCPCEGKKQAQGKRGRFSMPVRR